MFAIPSMLFMNHSVTSVIEPRNYQRLASMLAPLEKLPAMMTCPLHPLLLDLLISTVDP
jgi:hypothetical protein